VTDNTPAVGIVGAGPLGLAAAIAAKRVGLVATVWDRGPVCASIVKYPINMVFFTSNELLEIGDHPMVSLGPKATRREALDYYRKVAEREALDVRTHTEVVRITPLADSFLIHTRAADREQETRCAAAVVATGYYHRPCQLGVPGEDLPHVSHYYVEAHPHWRRRVVIVGGGNSAAEAALDLRRAGANVTMLVRGNRIKETVKYWVRPDLENRIREKSITAVFNAVVQRITTEAVHYRCAGASRSVDADAVLLLTGFVAEVALVREAGAAVREDGSVVLDPETYETTVPGLYVIGSAGYGPRTAEVFIENGRLHARAAIEHITKKGSR
jgi:thioredoxin reductase (NADPH)